MASNSILSDKGLVRGSVNVTIDGVVYRLKTGQRTKASRSNFEYDENGEPAASSHVRDFEKISGEIMAFSGTDEPSRNKPFLYDSKYWAVVSLVLNYTTEALRSYNVEITELAGTQASDFTETV